MKRKQFLCSIAGSSASLLLAPGFQAHSQSTGEASKKIVPPYLKPGDTVGICCPAGWLDPKDATLAISKLNDWGLQVKTGKTLGLQWLSYGGTDDERLADLQQMLDDDSIQAVLFGKGGYGIMRILPRINWEKFSAKPKWIAGFSDVTALHLEILKNTGMPSIHSIMCNSFKDFENDSMYSLKMALMGQPIDYQFKTNPANRPGKAKGVLVGGNLSMIIAMQASPSEIDCENRILFIEDVGEYHYSIDRMLLNLQRSGKLEGLAGLLIGGFSKFRETEEELKAVMGLEETVLEKLTAYNYPVAFGFPAGHQAQNLALKLGLEYELTVDSTICELRER